MTLSEYIDHIGDNWLTGWISSWRLNKTKTHIVENDIARLIIDFREHRFWAFASDIKQGTIIPVMIKPISEYTMEEIKAQYEINVEVNWSKYTKTQEAQRQIKQDFE